MCWGHSACMLLALAECLLCCCSCLQKSAVAVAYARPGKGLVKLNGEWQSWPALVTRWQQQPFETLGMLFVRSMQLEPLYDDVNPHAKVAPAAWVRQWKTAARSRCRLLLHPPLCLLSRLWQLGEQSVSVVLRMRSQGQYSAGCHRRQSSCSHQNSSVVRAVWPDRSIEIIFVEIAAAFDMLGSARLGICWRPLGSEQFQQRQEAACQLYSCPVVAMRFS